MLLGTGLVGGIFRNNGRYTAAEECIAMGAGDLFTVMEAVATHKNMDFPGHKHATLYNIYKIEPAVKKLLLSRGIKLLMLIRPLKRNTKRHDHRRYYQKRPAPYCRRFRRCQRFFGYAAQLQ